jgi:hypothetical protein
MDLIFGMRAFVHTCGGVWQCLVEHLRGRTQVRLEQARNQATAQAITLLPPGAELWETEPDGRTRIIRAPQPSPACMIRHDGEEQGRWERGTSACELRG